MTDPDYLVRARGICLNRDGRSILDQVDLDIARGQIVTLIGLNGAGKTSLVKAVLGLLIPDAGRISRLPGLRIGYSPQQVSRDPTLPLTVRRFLTLGSPQRGTSLEVVLEEVGAPGILDRQFPDLSGGELHRVLLARALLRKPDLLVLDEPLSGVDITGQSDLYQLIGGIRDHYSLGVLLVSHDLHLVMAATDHVVCLNQHVCCTGRPETVAGHPEFTNLFGDSVAETLGVYIHHHDHVHDVHGDVLEINTDQA